MAEEIMVDECVECTSAYAHQRPGPHCRIVQDDVHAAANNVCPQQRQCQQAELGLLREVEGLVNSAEADDQMRHQEREQEGGCLL